MKGIAACLRNAERLARAAERLLPTAPALALSVGVLSLEEVGKLLFVDGLLIAARDDYKTDAFREGQKKHHSKLGSLIRYLWALDWFAGLDPQRKADPVFLRTVHEKKVQWNEARKALAPWLGQDAALDGLDSWKQKGFYTDFSGGKIAEPEDAVSTDFATRVVHLASLTVDVLLFSSVATWSTTERRRWSCADRLRKSTLFRVPFVRPPVFFRPGLNGVPLASPRLVRIVPPLFAQALGAHVARAIGRFDANGRMLILTRRCR